jgi:hypothetical protein
MSQPKPQFSFSFVSSHLPMQLLQIAPTKNLLHRLGRNHPGSHNDDDQQFSILWLFEFDWFFDHPTICDLDWCWCI